MWMCHRPGLYNAAVNIREEGKRIFLTYLKAAMEKAEEAKRRQEVAKEKRQKKKKAERPEASTSSV